MALRDAMATRRFLTASILLASGRLVLARSPIPMAAPRARWVLTSGVTGTPTQRRDNPSAASNDKLCLFGVDTSLSPSVGGNDTWLLLGGTWIQLAPTNLPPVRRQHSLMAHSDFGAVLHQQALQVEPSGFTITALSWSNALTIVFGALRARRPESRVTRRFSDRRAHLWSCRVRGRHRIIDAGAPGHGARGAVRPDALLASSRAWSSLTTSGRWKYRFVVSPGSVSRL